MEAWEMEEYSAGGGCVGCEVQRMTKKTFKHDSWFDGWISIKTYASLFFTFFLLALSFLYFPHVDQIQSQWTGYFGFTSLNTFENMAFKAKTIILKVVRVRTVTIFLCSQFYSLQKYKVYATAISMLQSWFSEHISHIIYSSSTRRRSVYFCKEQGKFLKDANK